jgi:Flp pilus assembly protein TadG
MSGGGFSKFVRAVFSGGRPGATARLAAQARGLARDQGGNIAITFALALIPMTLSVGSAVDYSYANKVKAKLDAAADAAALSAVNKTAMGASAKDAEDWAAKMFNAQVAQARVKLAKLDVKVTEKGKVRSAEVKYTAGVQTSFMGLVGLNTMDVGGTATAASALATYIDFYLLLDNTPSMGVGATTKDIDTMVARTPDKCAFACHDLSDPNDYYSVAKKNNVAMRIDVVRQATQQLMDTASNTQAASGQFRMAIYTFGAEATNRKLTTIQSLTTDLSKAKSSAAAIDLMTVPYQNYAADTLTDFHSVLTAINKEMKDPGDGSISSQAQKILFFVSDGVADRALGSPQCMQATTYSTDPKTGQSYIRCQEQLDVNLCKTIKDRGIRIAGLYTTYLPLPTNSWYTKWIQPFSGKIAENMKACASEGLYFEVSPTQGISDAMTALFKKVVQQARLTL